MMGLTGVRPDATSRTAVILLGHGNLPPTEGKGKGVSRWQLHRGLKGEGERTLLRMGAPRIHQLCRVGQAPFRLGARVQSEGLR